MCKEFLKKIFLVCLMIFVVAGISKNSYALSNIYFVSNEKEMISVVEKKNDGDIVVLMNDIHLTNDLKLESTIMIDLNGKTLYILENDNSVLIGEEIVTKKQVCKEIEPGYYKDEVEVLEYPSEVIVDNFGNIVKLLGGQSARVTKVWNPPVVEVKEEDVYEYKDDIFVLIKNGNIVHCDGKRGEDGVENTWDNFNGKDGDTPKEPIEMISGTLELYNVAVYAGNGGDGGNGSYQSLLHMSFFGDGNGGKGGNGGNGAKGGNVIHVLRKECTLFVEKSLLVPGNGGRGGNLAHANPDMWKYEGADGQNGNNGDFGERFNLEFNK